MIKTHPILSHVLLLAVVPVFSFAFPIQTFETGQIAPGSTSLALYNCPSPGLTAEGTYSIGGSSSLCHPLWASVGAQAGSNYMIVNGSTGAGNLVYQQTVLNLTGNLNSVFSAYFAGLYPSGPAVLQLRVYNGTSSIGTPAAQIQFTSAINPPAVPSPTWTLQSLSFVPTGTQVTVQIYNTSNSAGGNDFGVDSLDVTQFGAALVATPEPATFLLAGSALLALAVRKKL